MQTRKCTKCNEDKPMSSYYKPSNRKKFCSWCRTCTQKLINARHEIKKIRLVQELGGKCTKCGWDKNPRALHFHHLDPKQKSFGISSKLGRKYETLLEEVKKCVLICANCHIIEHLVEIDPLYLQLVKKV